MLFYKALLFVLILLHCLDNFSILRVTELFKAPLEIFEVDRDIAHK